MIDYGFMEVFVPAVLEIIKSIFTVALITIGVWFGAEVLGPACIEIINDLRRK